MVRVAIVGAGSIAVTRHLPAWRTRTDAEIVAVVDVRSEVAERVATDHGVSRWTVNYRELLTGGVDLVDLCLPHHLHAPIAIDCLGAGLHVLVEKPMATSLAEARAMATAAETAGRVLMVAENWRYVPVVVEAARLIAEGAIGEPFLLRGALELYARQAGPHAWRLRPAEAGGGALLDSGVHLLSTARLLMGEVSEVSAVRPRQVWPELAPAEDTLALLTRHVGGAVGQLTVSWRAVRERAYYPIEVLGAAGSLSLDVETGDLALTRDGRREERPQPRADGFVEEIRHLLDSLRDGVAPRTAGVEEARTLAVALAAYRSVASGRSEAVESV